MQDVGAAHQPAEGNCQVSLLVCNGRSCGTPRPRVDNPWTVGVPGFPALLQVPAGQTQPDIINITKAKAAWRTLSLGLIVVPRILL